MKILHASQPLARQLAWLVLAGAAIAARAAPVDAPELARPGPQAVGVMAVSLDIGTAPSPEGKAAAERRLEGWLWYPAAGAPAAPREWAREIRAHAWRPLPSPTMRVAVPSVAQLDVPPAPGGRLPVVLLSHGLLNWAAGLNDLAEHLASRGYAVLGIEHDDERASNPLASALLLRPLDQAGALESLQRLDATPGHVLHRRLALDRVAVVGYSMGGYGALVSAGARVASDGMAFGYVPAGAMALHAQPMQGAQ
jgi:predicted dienelactone hydrolase